MKIIVIHGERGKTTLGGWIESGLNANGLSVRRYYIAESGENLSMRRDIKNNAFDYGIVETNEASVVEKLRCAAFQIIEITKMNNESCVPLFG